MASGVGSGYCSAAVGGVRPRGLGAAECGSCSLAPVSVKLRVGSVVVICGLPRLGRLGVQGFGHGFGALGRGG